MDRGFERIAAADPFDESSPRPDHSSDAEDAEPASSNYSSCDGSEFERYCSANSALGTASLCSSIGNYSELLDSVKNHTEFGEDFREKFQRNYMNGGVAMLSGFDCLSDGGVDSPREIGYSADMRTIDGVSSLHAISNGSKLFLSCDKSSSFSRSSDSGSGSYAFSRTMNGIQDEEKVQELLPLDYQDSSNRDNSGKEKIRSANNLDHTINGSTSDQHFQDEMKLKEYYGDNSSRDEHSEGEDSLLDSVTDNEFGAHMFERKNLQGIKETGNGSENPLFINSSVAFGSNDFEEFMQETEGDSFGSLSLHQNQSGGNLPVLSEALVDVPSADEMDENVANYRAEVIDQSSQREEMHNAKNSLRDHEVLTGNKALEEENSAEGSMKIEYDGHGSGILSTCNEPELPLAPLNDSILAEPQTMLMSTIQGRKIGNQEFGGASSLLPAVHTGKDSSVESVLEGNFTSMDMLEEDLVPDEVKKLDTFDSYDDMVLEMEEILLDSDKPHGYRLHQNNRRHTTQNSRHFRDDSSTASTSGTEDSYPLLQCPAKIDRVEIVGAKQKKGDVSFGERLVGVKEYTVYKLRVWSGNSQWEVERRYRDFFALYHQLKTLFTDHGLSLPSPWLTVEKESRKIFGNASPNVISARSSLIQDCLCSILNSGYPFGTPSSLVSFLSPGKFLVHQSLQKLGQDQNSNSSNCGENREEDTSMLGKTISLVVEIKPHKSMRQLLEAQHYTCAGCHRHLDAGKTLLREIVQTFGWNKPRICEYSGQLFCASCHTNDTVVLPAEVLHHWDFSLYPVSQFAKAYLESIYDQPMLCVSAVNPFLFSKVPALLHVMGIRKKIGAMLPYVRCPFRRSVQRSLGFRRHLLESNDFFALRDLVDLSKGPFAALPVMVETISGKILDHITQQCLVCYDSGVPCAARQSCNDPSSLIFPFQESEAERCALCGSIFHKPCFAKLMGCPCGKPKTSANRMVAGPSEIGGILDRSIEPSGPSSSSSFFSEILSKAMPDKIWKPKNSSPVILMGSLPSTSM